MEFSRQEYWNGLPFDSPGDLPDPGVVPGCLALQADSLLSELPGKPNSNNNCHLFSTYYVPGTALKFCTLSQLVFDYSYEVDTTFIPPLEMILLISIY